MVFIAHSQVAFSQQTQRPLLPSNDGFLAAIKYMEAGLEGAGELSEKDMSSAASAIQELNAVLAYEIAQAVIVEDEAQFSDYFTNHHVAKLFLSSENNITIEVFNMDQVSQIQSLFCDILHDAYFVYELTPFTINEIHADTIIQDTVFHKLHISGTGDFSDLDTTYTVPEVIEHPVFTNENEKELRYKAAGLAYEKLEKRCSIIRN